MEIMSLLVEFLSRENPVELLGYTVDMWPAELGIILGFLSFMVTLFFLSNQIHPMYSGKWSELHAIVTGPIIEEIIFRLILITGLLYLFDSLFIAVGGSAFLFALMHIPTGGGNKFISTLVMGVLYGFVFITFGIIPPIVAHMTHNFLAGVT